MAQKNKAENKRTPTNEKYWIREDLFEQSTGIRDKGKMYNEFIKDVLHNKDYFWKVIVVSVDIRKSSIALVNVEDFQAYQDAICDYVCHIAATWRLINKSYKNIEENHICFFDKFTGDGAIFFMALPDIEKYYKTDFDEYKRRWLISLKEAIQYCNDIVIKFLKTALPEIRNACGLLPADFGLSIGIDVGECLITDMRRSEEYKSDYKKEFKEARKYEDDYNKDKDKGMRIEDTFEDIGGNITVIGRPVIGASRMVENAAPYEILINTYGGANLYDDITFKKFQLRKRLDSIKEYDNCVEVYGVLSCEIDFWKNKAGVLSHRDSEQDKETKVPKKKVSKK